MTNADPSAGCNISFDCLLIAPSIELSLPMQRQKCLPGRYLNSSGLLTAGCVRQEVCDGTECVGSRRCVMAQGVLVAQGAGGRKCDGSRRCVMEQDVLVVGDV